MFKFKEGRQGTGYYKLMLWSFLFTDCYILKYEYDSFIPPHTDPVPKRRHFRLNITLSNKTPSCKFLCNKVIFSLFKGRIVLFRPDKQLHAVTRNRDVDNRYVLSIGVAI